MVALAYQFDSMRVHDYLNFCGVFLGCVVSVASVPGMFVHCTENLHISNCSDLHTA